MKYMLTRNKGAKASYADAVKVGDAKQKRGAPADTNDKSPKPKKPKVTDCTRTHTAFQHHTPTTQHDVHKESTSELEYTRSTTRRQESEQRLSEQQWRERKDSTRKVDRLQRMK